MSMLELYMLCQQVAALIKRHEKRLMTVAETKEQGDETQIHEEFGKNLVLDLDLRTSVVPKTLHMCMYQLQIDIELFQAIILKAFYSKR